MSWSKMKKQLESFLSPALVGRVEYLQTSYRYLPDKAGQCYIAVDQKKVFQMGEKTTPVRWYLTEQEIKNDPALAIPIHDEEIAAIRKDTRGAVPEERLHVIARSRKLSAHAKELLAAQTALSKSSFVEAANRFLTTSIEESLGSPELLLNVLALVDRRVGKKRLVGLAAEIKAKHPIVQFFYQLRLDGL